jgi:glyoxylase-like metal-dependent hydrolase (beta-lactamase superfamily II)
MDIADRLEIPTPFEVGRVNCYVFPQDELTLIDPGPATEEAYEELAAGLAARGYCVEDVDRVLITHPHMDHFGQANRIATESGASVVAHADAGDRFADPIRYFDREQEFFRPFLLSMGLPERLVDTVVGLPEPYTDFQEPIEVDRELEENDTVEAGETLKAVETPGHAPASLCFVATGEDAVFTGDHVLAEISPNPLLTLAPGAEDERTRSLPDYVASLRKLQSVDAAVGYGGHRGPIEDLYGRVREIEDHHQHRKEQIAEMLVEMGPTTAYRVMQEMFPDLPATEMFPGMSEVIGHLDLLEDEKRVITIERNGIRHYDVRNGATS